MSLFHIHWFRWDGTGEYGLFYDWRNYYCRCGQLRVRGK